MTIVLLLALPAAAHAESVKLVGCVPALDPLQRSATFEARTRARGSDRMQVRFTLQVLEEPALGWRRVVAEGFDTWLTSDAGVRRYSYAKTVQNLTAPASYRVQVRFRWLDEDGAVRARSRRASAACRQPELRPNLVPRRIDVVPDEADDLRHYLVTVRNTGRSDAGPFAVALRVGEEELDSLPVLSLAAGQEQVVAFVGPPCAVDAPLVVTVDGAEAVDERDEDDNVLDARCRA